MVSLLVRAGSFKEAQRLVGFPVYSIPGDQARIIVRLESSGKWATVHSIVSFKGSKLRIKQIFNDAWLWLGIPMNMIGSVRECGNYRKPEPRLVDTIVGTLVAFTGVDYSCREAGFIAPVTQIEARIARGNLEEEDLVELFEGIDYGDTLLTPILRVKPLPLWAWSMRSGVAAWRKAAVLTARLKWLTDPEELPTWLRDSIEVPLSIEEGRLDSLGYLAELNGGLALAIVYRRHSMNEFITVFYANSKSMLYKHPDIEPKPSDPDRLAVERLSIKGEDALYEEASKYGEARLAIESPRGYRLAVFSSPSPEHKRETLARVAERLLLHIPV